MEMSTAMDLGRFRVALPPISIKAETLFQIPTPLGPINFTNSMLFTIIVDLAIILFFIIATRRMRLVPGRLQNMGEFVIEFLLGTVEGTAGKIVGRRIFPLIATIFIFILVANWSGLLPGVGTVGHCVTRVVRVRRDSSSRPHCLPCKRHHPPVGCRPHLTWVRARRGGHSSLISALLTPT